MGYYIDLLRQSDTMQIDSSLNSGWKCCLLLLLAVAFQSSFPDVASLAVWLELREHSCCVLEMSCVLCALQGLIYISHYHILYTYHCALYTCVASYPYSLCVCVCVCVCLCAGLLQAALQPRQDWHYGLSRHNEGLG